MWLFLYQFMTTNQPKRVPILAQIIHQLNQVKPDHLTMTAFINDILYRTSKGLTPCANMKLSSEQSSPLINKQKKEKGEKKKETGADNFYNIDSNNNKEKKKIDYFSSAKIKKELVPDDLQRHSDLIVEWWAIRHKKKATCSEKVANRIFNKLRTFTLEEQIKALEMAIIRGYKDIFKPTENSFNKKEEPVKNHPSQKVFRASDFDSWPVRIIDEVKYVDDKK